MVFSLPKPEKRPLYNHTAVFLLFIYLRVLEKSRQAVLPLQE